MARIRSPNYPAISLREAIDRLHLLFSKAQNRPISREQAAESMGYEGLHGGSLGALSALLKYGLLDKENGQVRVTERGMSIVAPHDEDERQEAVNQAAFDPPLFSELQERFLGTVPNDDKLRSYLLRKGFGSSALDRVVRSFRETMDLVTEDLEGYDSKSEQRRTLERPAQDTEKYETIPATQLVVSGMRVSIVNDRLEVSANLSDVESVEKLIRALEANKELLPKKPPVPAEDEGGPQTGVPFMITQEHRKILSALGYSDSEIRHMTPDEAHQIMRANKRASY